MSRHEEPPVEPDNERALRELFEHAAPRAQPPARDAEEIRRAVLAEWDAVTRGRTWRRRAAGLAAAAAALAAAAVLFRLDVGTPPSVPIVARVERLQGGVEVGVDGRFLPLEASGTLARGAVIATHTGRAALALEGGGSLRIAAQSRVTLTSAESVRLDAGAVYFDSEGERAPNAAFSVVTALGTLRDVGTQFMASVESGELDVRVRDGRVALGADAAVQAAAGERLTLAGSRVRRERTATFGPEWAWAEQLAPPFAIDGRKLDEFLEWTGRQTGRSVAFADPAAERTARETVLSGSIDLEPIAKLMAVLALTDLEYSLDGDRILIRSR